MTYEVPARVRDNAATPIDSLDRYREHHAAATQDPDGFWLGVTKSLGSAGSTEPTVGLQGNYPRHQGRAVVVVRGREAEHHRVVPRPAPRVSRGDKIAILWEGDEPGDTRTLTYRELHEQVCKTANALRELGLKKGERAIIYMGMVPEAAIAMLACARIGAIPFRRVRRVLRRSPPRPDPGLRRRARHHPGHRAAAAVQEDSAQERSVDKACEGTNVKQGARLPAHRRRGRLERRPRCLVARGGGELRAA